MKHRHGILNYTLDTVRQRNNRNYLILDGGMGEELFKRGVPDDRKTWSARALLDQTHHHIVTETHEAFIEAGADIITTCNFAVTPNQGFSPEKISSLTALSGLLAQQAIQKQSTVNRKILIAGSLPPLVESYRADLVLPHDQGVEIYKLIVRSLDPFVDFFLAETMSSYDEAVQALEAVSLAGKEKTCAVSFSLTENGLLRSRELPYTAITQLFQRFPNLLEACLFNCSSPEAITLSLTQLMNSSSNLPILLGAYPNALTRIPDGWTMGTSTGPQPFRDDFPEKKFQEFAKLWLETMEIKIVGGCCGVGPSYIRTLCS